MWALTGEVNHTGRKAKLERRIKSNKQTRNQPEVPVGSPDLDSDLDSDLDFRSSIHLQLTDAFSHKLVCLRDGDGGLGSLTALLETC